jgi:hypothetical protein
MNQHQTEMYEARRKIVAERILKNLAHSPAHAALGALKRIDLAYSQAETIMQQPPVEEELSNPFADLGPDGFFLEQE